jgi:hypothetical protein
MSVYRPRLPMGFYYRHIVGTRESNRQAVIEAKQSKEKKNQSETGKILPVAIGSLILHDRFNRRRWDCFFFFACVVRADARRSPGSGETPHRADQSGTAAQVVTPLALKTGVVPNVWSVSSSQLGNTHHTNIFPRMAHQRASYVPPRRKRPPGLARLEHLERRVALLD